MTAKSSKFTDAYRELLKDELMNGVVNLTCLTIVSTFHDVSLCYFN